MKKRLILNILALCLLLTALAPAAYATETTEATEIVRAADECGEGIKWRYEEGVLTITGEGKMDDFTDGGEPWRAHKDEIEEVIMEGGVTYVGAYAFKDYDNLLAVEFGDAMYEIGPEAFRSCDGLTSVRLPASFKIFGESSFLSCKNLEEFHCAGRFPSFRQNCMWDTYATIYYPAANPWGTEYIEQLETAFHGRIQFLASDGTDHYQPTEDVTEPTEEETVPETTAPAPTEPEATEPVEETVPQTEAATEPVQTEPEATESPVTEPEATEPVQEDEGRSSGSWIGFVIIAAVLCFLILGALIFGRRNRHRGRFSK